jgi:hypothetical protein
MKTAPALIGPSPGGRTSHFAIRRSEKVSVKCVCGHEAAERRLIALGAAVLRAGECPRAWLVAALDAVGARRYRRGGPHRFIHAPGTKAERRRARPGYLPLPYPKGPDLGEQMELVA